MSYWPSLAVVWFKEALDHYLIETVDESDLSRASAVKIGQLQLDPSRLRISVEVHENDPDDEAHWQHNVIEESAAADNLKPRGTIGGTRAYWNRRFAFVVNIYLRGLDREEAGVIKGKVMARIEQMLLEHPQLDGVKDERGEVALNCYIKRENGILSGDNRLPIYRHKVWLQATTYRPRHFVPPTP